MKWKKNPIFRGKTKYATSADVGRASARAMGEQMIKWRFHSDEMFGSMYITPFFMVGFPSKYDYPPREWMFVLGWLKWGCTLTVQTRPGTGVPPTCLYPPPDPRMAACCELDGCRYLNGQKK